MTINNKLTTLVLAGSVALCVGACGTSAQDVTPTTTATTSTPSLPPQPTRIVGKYPDPETMAAKVKAAGVPLVLTTGSYMNSDHTNIYGVRYMAGDAKIGSERIGFYTFDWAKYADDAESYDRREAGLQTYRGDGWYVSAKSPETLAKLVDILNK